MTASSGIQSTCAVDSSDRLSPFDGPYGAQGLAEAPDAPVSFQPEAPVGMILLIVLILLLVGSVPRWPHSRNWGYRGSGIVGTLLIIVLVLFLLGHLHI